MSRNATPTQEGIDLEPRDVRALTECMSVLGRVGHVKDANDMYLVVSESGSEYTVDLREGACECPDAEHREVHCKHIRAVEYATGRRPIPTWVNREAIENTLGEHIEESPVFETDESEPEPEPAAVTAAEIDAKPSRAVVTDGGQVFETDESEENHHAPGCENPECEGLDADGRPLLSFPCWKVWASPEARR